MSCVFEGALATAPTSRSSIPPGCSWAAGTTAYNTHTSLAVGSCTARLLLGVPHGNGQGLRNVNVLLHACI